MCMGLAACTHEVPLLWLLTAALASAITLELIFFPSEKKMKDKKETECFFLCFLFFSEKRKECCRLQLTLLLSVLHEHLAIPCTKHDITKKRKKKGEKKKKEGRLVEIRSYGRTAFVSERLSNLNGMRRWPSTH